MNRRQLLLVCFTATIGAALPRLGVNGAADPNPQDASASTIFVHPKGVDTHPGTRDRPLLTLAAAAKRVNESKGAGAMSIVLSEGVYAVGEQALFKPEHRKFSRTERLTIRAEVLPDDPDWHTGRMPTLIQTMPLEPHWNGRNLPPGSGGTSYGIEIETSHVTIQGLKILGAPVVETPKRGMLNRVYPIGRYGKDLDDLEIAQCLFAGDSITNPHHLGIIANGTGLNVHHCVFHGVKLTVVFWTGGSTGHAMRNCLVHGASGSGVWTCDIASDFDFRNNIVANGNYVWTFQSSASTRRDPDAAGAGTDASEPTGSKRQVRYKVIDSLFAGNKKLACSGTGPSLGFKDIAPSFLELVGTSVSEQGIDLELDSTKRDYLHPVAGSDAARVGAGLFMKPTE